MLEIKMLKRMKEIMPTVMFQDIESSTGLGIPDVFYSRYEISGWIEDKELSRIPRNYFKMPWRPGQLAWYHDLRNKYQSHIPYFIILTLIDRWYILDSKIIKMKEHYTMEEIDFCYLCTTKELAHNVNEFKNRLYIDN
jgi:hypothetical protein